MNGTSPSTVVLSPHLDDAVLSCGGLISSRARRGHDVLVVTVFAASPPRFDLTELASELQRRWGHAEDPVAVRRSEDKEALALLGARSLHLPFLDCVYRQDPASDAVYYPDEEALFGDVHTEEAEWHRDLAHTCLSAIPDLDARQILAPLAIGHHVDHIIVRRMACALLEDSSRVSFYEDYPYAGNAASGPGAWIGDSRCTWTSNTDYFGARDLSQKIAAAARYASQISTFWEDADEMAVALRGEAERVTRGHSAPNRPYGERLWRTSANCAPDV